MKVEQMDTRCFREGERQDEERDWVVRFPQQLSNARYAPGMPNPEFTGQSGHLSAVMDRIAQDADDSSIF
jgi:hypothetical protein